MSKIYSGDYYGTDGTKTEAAGIGLMLGNEKNGATLTSSAFVEGGTGFTPGQPGGIGLAVASGAVTNYGSVLGGFGGNASKSGKGNAGDGGVAVSFAASGTFTNHGIIDGGLGGVGGTKTAAGNGGAAVYMRAGGTVINDFEIYGGSSESTKASTGEDGGDGAAGIILNGNGIVLNLSTIAGGAGLVGGEGIDAKRGGAVINFGDISGGAKLGTLGGAGVSLGVGGVLLNLGTITGGNEYEAGTSGGIGAIVYGGKAPDLNGGLILGGSALPSTFGVAAYGAAGLEMQTAGTLINIGTIAGGTGTDHEGTHIAPAVLLAGGSTFINAGTLISGGIASGAVAVEFGDGGSSRLILDPGFLIEGDFAAGQGAGNVVELASGNFGLLSTLHDQIDQPFGNFQKLQLDSGSSGTITGLTAVYAHPTVQLDYHSDWGLSGTITNLLDTGTLTIESGTSLDVGEVDSLSFGIFALTGKASLEIGQLLGSQTQIEFLGSNSKNLLTIDNPSKFGLDVGGTNFAGPLLEDFRKGDEIDLKGTGNAGLKTNYNTATGVLQISSSSAGVVASLQFQTASLGAGSFHLGSDGSGGVLLQLT